MLVTLAHLSELVFGAFPDLEEVSDLGLALLIGELVHHDMLLM